MSLLKDSLNLTHHSLESYIIQQSEGQLAYQFYSLAQHPKISSISQKITQIWKIFSSETYLSAKQKNLLGVLNQKQIKSLRIVSILSAFQDKKSVSIVAMCKQLEVDKFTLFKLLLQMSSKQLANIKIDQQKDCCLIFASKRRLQQQASKQMLAAQCQARLNKVYQQNLKLSQLIGKNM